MSSQDINPLNPYATAHASPQGAGDARPTAMAVIKDLNMLNKLTDKTILVTGASSGIGIETTRAFYATGARVFMGVRDIPKASAVRDEILESDGGKSKGSLELLELRLDSLESVRKAVDQFKAKSDKLHLLINNAGVRNPPEGRTVDGFEIQFGTNHLGHFLLFELLKETMLASTPARVINITSGAHRDSPIRLDNPNLEGIYTPRLGYSHSKTANILMTNYIARHYGPKGLQGLAVHPGVIRSGAQRHDPPGYLEKAFATRPDLLTVEKTSEQGAAPTVWAALSPALEGVGGVYIEECRIAHISEEPTLLEGGVRSFCFNEELEDKLWRISEEMVGSRKTGEGGSKA